MTHNLAIAATPNTSSTAPTCGGSPLVALALFRAPSFARGSSAALLFYASNATLFVVLPFYLQQARGVAPTQVGPIFATLAVPFAAVSTVAGRASGQRLLRAGTLVLLAGYAALITLLLWAGSAAGEWHLVPILVVLGAGMGLVNPSLSVVATSDVTQAQVGSASGLITTALELGYAIGVVMGAGAYAAAQTPALGALSATAAFVVALALPLTLTLAINQLAALQPKT